MPDETPTWKQSAFGGGEFLSLAGGFIRISCFHDSGTKSNPVPDDQRYRWSYNGFKSNRGFSSLEECKRVALNSALNKLNKAHEEIKKVVSCSTKSVSDSNVSL